jgi:pimeloyl-ACP methyl ester carboxylesterase
MRGVLAIRAALAHPPSVSHVVLTATSGVDLRRSSRRTSATTIVEATLTRLPGPTNIQPSKRRTCGASRTPTVLIWAARDPISPPAVGRHLATPLPNATLLELDHTVTCLRARGSVMSRR